MRNLLLTDELSVVDGQIAPPPTHRPEHLGDLLTIVSERLEDGGVLALSGSWADLLTSLPLLPDTVQEAAVNGEHGQVVWRARMHPDDVWVRWTRQDGRHTIWTADLDAMEPGTRSTPLVDALPVLTAAAFARWTAAVGTPWIGTPSMMGNALLIDGGHRGRAPRWQDRDYGRIVGDCEAAYSPRDWHADHDGPVTGYDTNKAYLSAYLVCELAADALEHAARPAFDRSRGGFWRVELEPWTDSRLPDPAGYGAVLDDGTRWLTTPTLALITELVEQGRHGGYRVVEAYTAPARRITRTWAERLRDVLTRATEAQDAAVAYAVKRVYQATWGAWLGTTGRIRRADWHYSILATARTNLWRKIDRYGREDDVWPVRIDTDAVFYPAAAPVPTGMRLDPTGLKLGTWKVEQ